MNDKQLRKAKKNELLEMLYYMRRALDKVQEENSQLRERLDKLVAEAISAKNDTNETDDERHE